MIIEKKKMERERERERERENRIIFTTIVTQVANESKIIATTKLKKA